METTIDFVPHNTTDSKGRNVGWVQGWFWTHRRNLADMLNSLELDEFYYESCDSCGCNCEVWEEGTAQEHFERCHPPISKALAEELITDWFDKGMSGMEIRIVESDRQSNQTPQRRVSLDECEQKGRRLQAYLNGWGSE